MRSALLFILITLSSCSFFYKKIGGISDPKIETYSSVTSYSRKFGIDSSQLVFTKDTAAFNKINYYFNGSPEILIFDKNKGFHPYKEDSVNCNAPIDVVLHNICNASSLSAVSHRMVSYDKLVAALDDHYNVLTSANNSEYDYIVFMNFAKFFHGINNTHLPDWIAEEKRKKDDCRVVYIFVNFDYLDTWGISKKDLPHFKLNSNKK